MTAKNALNKVEEKKQELAASTYGVAATQTNDELDKDSYAIPRIAIIEALSNL